MSNIYISLLLESGAPSFVNDIRHGGNWPLKITQTREDTSLLLAHGAYRNAVSRPNHPEIDVNLYFNDDFPVLLSLKCSSAQSIISKAILYQSIDLPCDIIVLIASHDPDNICVISEDDMNYCNSSEIAIVRFGVKKRMRVVAVFETLKMMKVHYRLMK